MTTAILIPVYKPGEEFRELLHRLIRQTVQVDKILIMNTEKDWWDEELEKEFPLLEVHHVTKKDFDHGGTRQMGADLWDGDVLICMTQDALPKDRHLVENLLMALMQGENVASAYGRQLPRANCMKSERYTRSFNYGDQPFIKTKEDRERLGIKTYFCSDVCAAYKMKYFRQLGGFVRHTLFNEDMIYACSVIEAGLGIAYAPDAKVIHSHNYTPMQQFHRNFDLGVSQAEHPEVFDGLPSEGEGIRMVVHTLAYLLKCGEPLEAAAFFFQAGARYIGYRMGKKVKYLPRKVVLHCTTNPDYFSRD